MQSVRFFFRLLCCLGAAPISHVQAGHFEPPPLLTKKYYHTSRFFSLTCSLLDSSISIYSCFHRRNSASSHYYWPVDDRCFGLLACIRARDVSYAGCRIPTVGAETLTLYCLIIITCRNASMKTVTGRAQLK